MPSSKIPIWNKHTDLLALILCVAHSLFPVSEACKHFLPSPVPSSRGVVPFSASGLLPGPYLDVTSGYHHVSPPQPCITAERCS